MRNPNSDQLGYPCFTFYETKIEVSRIVHLKKGAPIPDSYEEAIKNAVNLRHPVIETMVETYTLRVTQNAYDGGMYRGALVNTTDGRDRLQATTREHTARAAAEKMARCTGHVAAITRINNEFDALESNAY